MAVAEGLQRIKVIGRVTLLIGIAVGGFGLLSGFVMAHFYNLPPMMLIFGVIGLYLSLLGAVVLLGAWVLEGFLVPRFHRISRYSPIADISAGKPYHQVLRLNYSERSNTLKKTAPRSLNGESGAIFSLPI